MKSISLQHWPTALQWLALVALAGGAGASLYAFDVPAGRFIGPMLVAILFGVAGARVRIHRQVFRLGQGCVGLLVAHSMTLAVLLAVVQSWPEMLFATVLTVVLSAAVGLAMVRFGGISGSTAAWGTAPGAASAMVAMAEEYGADSRIVATMQYVRVVCVVMAGALVSHWLGASGHAASAAHPAAAFDGQHLWNLVVNLLILVGGVYLGSWVPADRKSVV